MTWESHFTSLWLSQPSSKTGEGSPVSSLKHIPLPRKPTFSAQISYSPLNFTGCSCERINPGFSANEQRDRPHTTGRMRGPYRGAICDGRSGHKEQPKIIVSILYILAILQVLTHSVYPIHASVVSLTEGRRPALHQCRRSSLFGRRGTCLPPVCTS